MDATELRARQADLALRQLHHQTGLRHSDLQRRFLFGLTVSAGVFVSLLRSEVPAWATLLGFLPLLWSVREARRMERLVVETARHAERIILAMGAAIHGTPKSSIDRGGTQG